VRTYQNLLYPTSTAWRGVAIPRRVSLTALLGNARLALGAILVLALALRVWGLAFGLPYIIQPDEPSVEDRALAMWLNGTANPHYFIYPSLYYDMQAGWAFLVGHVVGVVSPDVLRHPLLHKPLYYLAGRLLTAVVGTMTVFVVYLTGRLFSTRVGLLSALFLAVAAQHVEQSHYITVDATTGLFTILSAYCALRALRDGGAGPLLWGSVAAGLAAGVKYNAALALALPLLAALLQGDRPWRSRLQLVAGATLLCGATFLLTTPYAILDHTSFLRDLHTISVHYATGHPGAEGGGNVLWYLGYLFDHGVGPGGTILALSGLVAIVSAGKVIGGDRRNGVVVLVFAVAYYVLLCSTYVRFDRNLLPLSPFVALLAAVAAVVLIPVLARLLRNYTVAGALVFAVVVVPSVYTTARDDVTFTHRFSEEAAVTWADAHWPRGAAVAIENWEGKVFLASSRGYKATLLNTLATESYAWLRAHVRYAVADSWTDGAYLSNPTRYPLQAARYKELYHRARLLQIITPDSIERPGPEMRLYEVR